MRRLRAAFSPAWIVLGVIVVVGLALRVLHNDYGLPYVYNVDEGSHFTSRAVAMFGGDASPGYFQNPSAYTYLVHAALRLRYGHGWPFGDFDSVVEAFKLDPTGIYQTARWLAALICMVGVVAVYWVGRRLWGTREGLLAAAILSFAFLPVTYSRIAVTDVGTLATVALSVYFSVRVYEGGTRRDFLLAGLFAGLAVGFKYTAGLVLVPLLIAATVHLRRDPRAVVDAGLAALAGAVAFFVTTPFFFFEFDDARRQLDYQAELAGEIGKAGQGDDTGVAYYLDSLTWGLGWLAGLLALAGAVFELRRDLVRGLVLVSFPLALFAYLALQQRYFGRWLLPSYPVLALLAGYGLVRLVDLVPLRRPAWRLALLVGAALVVLAQPVAADVRSARLLGRTDTRQLAREYLVDRMPPRLRIVIEPAVPGRYYRRTSRRVELLSRKQFVRGFIQGVQESRIDYTRTIRPETIDRYRELGFCTVMTMSVIRGRAEKDGDERALAYYRRLEDESELLKTFDPWEEGADPPEFHFDLSYNYYSPAFDRPGPEVRIYRLDDCKQQYGPIKDGT
jgi:hypothetical protein